MSKVHFSDYANYNYLHYERADVEDEIIPLIRPLLEFRWARGKGVKWGDKFGESAQLSWSIGTTTSSTQIGITAGILRLMRGLEMIRLKKK